MRRASFRTEMQKKKKSSEENESESSLSEEKRYFFSLVVVEVVLISQKERKSTANNKNLPPLHLHLTQKLHITVLHRSSKGLAASCKRCPSKIALQVFFYRGQSDSTTTPRGQKLKRSLGFTRQPVLRSFIVLY